MYGLLYYSRTLTPNGTNRAVGTICAQYQMARTNKEGFPDNKRVTKASYTLEHKGLSHATRSGHLESCGRDIME